MADGNTGQAITQSFFTAGSNTAGYGNNVGDLEKLFRQAEQARERFIGDWYLNSAYYVGQQWLYWNRGRLDQPRLAPHRVTLVDNRILPVVLSRVSRKVKNKPSFVCVPYTADDDAAEMAQVGENVLENDWKSLELQRQLFRAQVQCDITGASFWKVFWDQDKGEKADFLFEGGQPVMLGDGTPARAEMLGQLPPEQQGNYEVRPVGQGDVSVEVCSPFEIYPDPLGHNLDEVEWLVEKKVRSINYVRQKYDYDPVPDAAAPLGPVEARIFASTVYAGNEADYRGVAVYEYWCKPNVEHPKGKRCVWANDTILYEEEPFDPMPYVMWSGIQVPERFWPTSIVTQLRGPQTELNKVRSAIQENAARVGNPSLLRSRQADVEFSGKPGADVLFDATVPDAKPEFLQPPEVPTYVREEVERIVDSISEISGLHEVSKAQVPTGVTAASAINLLMEADDTRIGPEIQDLERSLEQAGEKILRLRARFNTDERIIRLAGEDGAWDIFTFRGAMLGDNPMVEVQAGSAMPRSKAAQQAAMTEILGYMVQYGIELDPRALRRFLKDYGVGSLERLFENTSYDETQIQRENRQMSQGQPVPIKEWDNDELHIEGHDEFRKSARFERLAPPIQAMISEHVTQHRQRMVQAVNLQIQQQAAEQQAQQQQQFALEAAQEEQKAQHQQEAQQQKSKQDAVQKRKAT